VPIIVITTSSELDLFRERFEVLRIERLADWDVLAFVSRHGTSLASAERISRLVGYSKATVGAALDSLTSTGLVQRSRNSHGIRLYRLALTEGDVRLRALEEVMQVVNDRKGRLLLINHLRQTVTRKERRERGGLHLA
jgi:DNA-binding MarR family transcriptional regulator